MENVKIIIFLVFERPSGFEDVISLLSYWRKGAF